MPSFAFIREPLSPGFVAAPPDLTIDQVAAELSFHPVTVRNLVRAGKIPAYKPGTRHWRIRREDLDAFKRRKDNTAT